MAYLLTGQPRVGKSTLIQEALARLPVESRSRCGGFYTEEVKRDGERQGFDIVTCNDQRMRFATLRSQDKDHRRDYDTDIAALRLAVRAVEDAIRHGQLIILDEIGPLQARSFLFQTMVLRALAYGSDRLIGTIAVASDPWLDQIKQRDDVHLVTVTVSNRRSLRNAMTEAIHDGTLDNLITEKTFQEVS